MAQIASSIGIDFGTSNTVIALADAHANVRTIQFGAEADASDVYRSILCFQKQDGGGRHDIEVNGGAEAIEAYLTSANDVRFIQSIKSHAASRLFEETRIFGTPYKFEDLLASFLQCAVKDTSDALENLGTSFISGRPVAFVGSAPDDALAMTRYEAGYAKAGFPTPKHVYEPVGAAYSYARRLKNDATVLVGDFGGGTSDFSIIKFEKTGGRTVAHPIGYAGIGIAGDRFDYRIIDAVISPKLGKYGQYRSFNKLLEMPKHYYTQFAKWHQLALLKSPETIRALRELEKAATKPEQIEALIETIVDDRGFDIYSAVSSAKTQLSSNSTAKLQLKLGDIDIDETIAVEDFNHWISPDIAQIASKVDSLLESTGLDDTDIDNVFLTGGSSFIPAVKKIFADRFGIHKLAGGNQFQSVAIGLSLIGLEDDVSPWLANAANKSQFTR
ncbi:Hsp70 family protein [Maritalea sp.]|uniref:Hsp70 family protein n=1 Tax=Maritalea sp. TaxID=2003361 RepID=UPI003EF93EEE